MRKVFIFSMLSLISVASYAISGPQTSNGGFLPIEYAGCQVANIDSSTGTSLVMINSTGTGGLSTGRAVVYGIITSSISQSDYIVLKDTTGKGSNGQIAGQTGLGSLQGVGSTVAVIGNWLQNVVSTFNIVLPYPTLNLIKFPIPLQFSNGILAVTSAAPTSNSGVSRWTILYRKLDQTEK